MSHRQGMAATRGLALRRLLGGPRAIPPLLAAAAPALVAGVAAWHGAPDLFRVYGDFLAPLCLYFVLPFLAMFTMLPVVGELYSGGAPACYLFTRPVPRWVPLLGMFQGGLLAMLPSILLATGVPAAILAVTADEPGLGEWLGRALGLAGTLAIGGFAYGGLCFFLGVWSRRALIWAVFLLFGWGAAAGSLPGALRSFSLHRYLLGLAREWCGIKDAWSGFFAPEADPPSVSLSLIVLLGSGCIFFAAAWRASLRRDVL